MNWPMVKLKDCCSVVGGATPKRDVPEYWSSKDIPWATPKDISTLDDKILQDAPEYISQKGFEKSATYLLPEGSVLLTSRAPIGNVAIAGKAMCTNQGFKSLVPSKETDSTYLYYCISAYSNRLEALGNGATFKEVSKKTVEEFEIPLPPLDKQKRIAAILDKADAIRHKRQQAIKLADDFLKSVFLDMFGDPVTNPKGWDVYSIDSFTSNWRGGAPFKPEDFSDSGINVLHKGAIQKNNKISIDTKKKTFTTEEFAKKYKKSEIDRSFLAVTLRDLVPTGPSIGLVADLKLGPSERYILAQGAYGFRYDSERVTPSYLVYLSNNQSFRATLSKYWVGSTQIHIRTPIYKEIEIPLPPIALQRKFEAFVNSVASLKGKFVDKPSQSGVLFNSLSQKAFAGEL